MMEVPSIINPYHHSRGSPRRNVGHAHPTQFLALTSQVHRGSLVRYHPTTASGGNAAREIQRRNQNYVLVDHQSDCPADAEWKQWKRMCGVPLDQHRCLQKWVG